MVLQADQSVIGTECRCGENSRTTAASRYSAHARYRLLSDRTIGAVAAALLVLHFRLLFTLCEVEAAISVRPNCGYLDIRIINVTPE